MSNPNAPPGRSRGRAKARSRGPAAVGEKQPVPQQQVEPLVPPGPTAMQPAGGRRNHRGAPRAEVPRSEEGLAEKMSGLEVTEGAGRGASRRRDDYALDNTRPINLTDKRGTSGEAITIVTNYFKVLSKPAWAIQQYHVDFAPIVESSYIRKVLLSTHREVLGSCYLFDGMSDLKTVTRLESGTELFTQRNSDGVNIRITLKHVGELAPNHPELGHLFNTQMRRNLQHLKFQLLGRHYFDQNAISEVPQHRLQIWQGVVTSIRQQEDDLMMSVDTVHKVVRKETAVEVMRELARKFPNNYQEECIKELVGCIVMTQYNNRTYRIEDICWELNPAMTFDTKKDGPITYKDYYSKQYDIKIGDMKQPLLLCTSKEREFRGGDRERKKIYLVPEVCSMTGLTDSMRANFTMMKDLAKLTKLNPGVRVKNLITFINRINSNPTITAEMNSWGLRFSNELVRFQSRVLPSEQIVQGSCKYGYDQKSADFSREMRGKSMHMPKNLENWLVICPEREKGLCTEFLNTLNRVCPPMGMRMRPANVVTIGGDRVAQYIQALKENMTPNTSIVVFIVPNNKKDRYDALKKNTCIDNPIPSQVIVSRTLSKQKMLMSVATKIGIQLNCKLGGEPWAVEIPLKAGVMIVGYDAYHDSSKRGRSAGGFVASLNQTFTRWYSRVRFHQAGAWQELSDHLKINLTEALRKYQAINKHLPNMILFYRDGVGDGQIRYVKQWEVTQFEDTLKSLIPDSCKDGRPRCAFIVVNKQINSRFFSVTGPEHYANPPPGTVVDSVVTRSDRYDFFLVSQSVREGTVGPTMYNIISDASGLRPEHQQRLAYKLSHLYFNWPGTIRVPAPCQYAHKLAFLSGQSLHREPAEQLSDKLFYL